MKVKVNCLCPCCDEIHTKQLPVNWEDFVPQEFLKWEHESPVVLCKKCARKITELAEDMVAGVERGNITIW